MIVGYIQNGANSVSQATGVSSAGAALPNDSAGNVPRLIRVAATAAAYFRLGSGGVPTATSVDILVQPGDAIVIATNGRTHFAAIQVAAAGTLSVTPLEH